MLIAQILIVLTLLAIFMQDLKSRAVYWFWFPLLILLFSLTGHFLYHEPFNTMVASTLFNMGFLLLQLLLVSIYFSIKYKRIVNITESLLGWGDILLLGSIAFFLSALNYMVFYILSLLIVFIIGGGSILFNKKHNQIPLAGLQAMILIVCLIVDWSTPQIDLTNDDWLMHYLQPAL